MVSFFISGPTESTAIQKGAMMAGYSASDVKVESVGSLNVPGENSIVVKLMAKMAPSLAGSVKKTVENAVSLEMRKYEGHYACKVTDCRYTDVGVDGIVREVSISLQIFSKAQFEEESDKVLNFFSGGE